MTYQSKIDYRIEKLKAFTGLNLKDDWLMKGPGNYAKSHRLSIEYNDNTMDDITIRYSSIKQFLYVLDSMIKLFLEMEKTPVKDIIDNYIDSHIYEICRENRDIALEVLKP